jgi:hypothetical protein
MTGGGGTPAIGGAGGNADAADVEGEFEPAVDPFESAPADGAAFG